LIVEVIARKGSSRLETDVKCLYDEVLTLTTAIEEAIIRGQKAFGTLSGSTQSIMTADEELDLADVQRRSRLVGWVDDI
jgi:hypothetical protein